jgi:hypothetical protein
MEGTHWKTWFANIPNRRIAREIKSAAQLDAPQEFGVRASVVSGGLRIMGNQIFTHSVASVSWIDHSVKLEVFGVAIPFTSLPVNDGVGPPNIISRQFISSQQGFRFANLLEATVVASTSGTIQNYGFTPYSKIYADRSFRGEASTHYRRLQSKRIDGSVAVFTQIVGARTHSVDQTGRDVGRGVGSVLAGGGLVKKLSVLGGKIGGDLGEKVAHHIFPFPPIWSELELRIDSSGSATAKLVRFSLFPSLTDYTEMLVPRVKTARAVGLKATPLSAGAHCYNAGQAALDKWNDKGWDTNSGLLGPVQGNPWHVGRDDPDPEVVRVGPYERIPPSVTRT